MKFGYAPLTVVPTQKMVEIAKIAESQNFDTIGLPYEGWNRSPFQMCSSILHETKKIHARVLCANIRLFHAVAIAIEAGTLADSSNGRSGIGVCPGSPFALSQIGQKWDEPIKEIENTVTAIKMLLMGEPVHFESETVTINGIKLGWKPPKVPVLLTGSGPKMINLAARIADGIILDAVPLKALPQVVSWVEAGLDAAGRKRRDFELVNMMGVGIRTNNYDGVAGAKHFSVWQVGTKYKYIIDALPNYKADMEKVRSILPDQPAAAKAISDRVMREFGIIGTPNECQELVLDYEAAGINSIMVMPPYGIAYDTTAKIIGKHLITPPTGSSGCDCSSCHG